MKHSCDIEFVNKKQVLKIRKKMPSVEKFEQVVELYKILGDSTRIKILRALCFGELCVCDIANLLNISQSAISHQLRILRSSRYVKYRKEGKMAYYYIDDEKLKPLLDTGFESF